MQMQCQVLLPLYPLMILLWIKIFTIHNLIYFVVSNSSSDIVCFDNMYFDEWYSHIIQYLCDGTFIDTTNRNTRTQIRILVTR